MPVPSQSSTNLTAAADWRPRDYRRFESERTRPAADLLARVPLGEPRTVVDLGCGPGNSTELLLDRYPRANILGLDSSSNMLDSARTRLPDVEFRQGDIADWRDADVDLAFANASLHWIPNHIEVMRGIAERLPSGGCLAVQMPDNEGEPSHVLMREIADAPRFRAKLADAAAARQRIGAFGDYNDALSPFCDSIDVWRTIYVHRLAGPAEIVAWVESAGLRPYLAPLDADDRADYLALYSEGIARAYPPRASGGVLLPFPRLFIVAKRRSGD